MKEETEGGILKMINELISLDKKVELQKNDTASKHDFNTYDAFRIFDIDGVGSVAAQDLKYGLSDIGVFVSMEDILLFVNRFDRD